MWRSVKEGVVCMKGKGNREVFRVVQILEEIDVKCMVFCSFLDILIAHNRMKKLSQLVCYILLCWIARTCKWLATYNGG